MLKLLIGYDGSEPADAAIQDLARAGLPRDVEATVLSVADLPTEVPYPNYGSDSSAHKNLPAAVVQATRENAARVVSEAQQAAQKGAELVRSAGSSWNVKHETLVDSPAWGIVRRAQESFVDLIVVGSQGRSRLGRLTLGSVSQNVLQHAHCSVRLGRINAAAPGKTTAVNLLLGVDGSHHSAVAVSAIAARPWPSGTQVKVITALDRRFWTAIGAGALASEWIGEGESDERSWARKAVDEVARDLAAVGLVATADVVEGDPQRVLVDEAKRSAADCIFVGAKGHTRIERLLLGSVSAGVAASAPCSVEIVRHG